MDEEKVIMCFGDSNTWGYNPATRERFPRGVRWAGRLQNLLGDGYYVIEEGLNSRTVVWDDPVCGDKSGLKHLTMLLVSHKPLDLVIVMLGTNDCQDRFGLNGFNIARSMERVVRAVKDSECGPDGRAPKLLLISPAHIRDNLPETWLGESMGLGSVRTSKEIAKYYKLLAEESGAYFLDAEEYVKASPTDAVHLDTEAHAKLADAVCMKIKQIFEN